MSSLSLVSQVAMNFQSPHTVVTRNADINHHPGIGGPGPHAHSPEGILSEALHSVRSLLGMEVAFVSEFSSGRRIFRYVDCCNEFAPIHVGGSDPVEDTYCQRVIDGRLPELLPNVNLNHEARNLPITSALGIGVYVGVPIQFSDGALYGTFCCFSSRPDESLNNQHLDTVRLFARFVGKVLERQANDHSRQEAATRLRNVMDDESFDVVYQPIVHVAENRLVGHEALARFLADPIRTPDLWFSEAAEVGCQEELELAVIKKAIKGLAYVPEGTYISFNVSPETILTGSLNDALDGHPLNRLVLEVTEHALVNDYASIANHLASLRKRGLRVAVDDAGAGFASFRHILKLKPDIIKLDSSLIQRIDIDQDSRALAAALIRFAEETGSKIVAEGVETESELQTLRDLKVNKVQGFLIGRPKPLLPH